MLYIPDRKNWSDFSPRQKAFYLTLMSVQLSLLMTALADIARRPASEINGSKAKWVALSFISFVGPILYFARGRRAAHES